MSVDFCAVDGEAIEDIYCLMCASTGDHVLDLQGLSTRQSMEFLLALKRRKRVIVAFGLNYDVNQWLASVPISALRELWNTGNAVWREYAFTWVPGRWFTVKHIDGRTAKIHEVFGFFQSSFIRALEDWDIPVRAEVRELKAERGRFTDTMRRRIISYCHAECTDLVTLMQRLEDACIEADCVPRSWIGAGALAGAMLKSRGVAEHHCHDMDLGAPGAVEPIMCAYFGGRVEMLAQGNFENVLTADLRSAYPAAATRLPSLQGASLAWRKRYSAQIDHAVWRCSWDVPDGRLMPFPVRNRMSIYYPRRGTGWYHACEVRAARSLGYPIRVHGGWALKVRQGAGPFDWVPEAYEIRRRWQREGRAAQKALKLGLNSLYGKVAQGYGMGGKLPDWQSYMWAGEITARTRARMLEAAHHLAETPIMIATDGLFYLGTPAEDEARLGAWEAGGYERLHAFQPGVYSADDKGREVLRSRGFFAAEVDYGALADGYAVDGADHVYKYESTRFVGLGTALHRKDMRLWRSWHTAPRKISLYPQRKVLMLDGTLAPFDGTLADSEPYVPKSKLLATDDIENVQATEQPMRNQI